MSSGFVTEAEVQEARRIRQEEWEKVRKPDQPVGKNKSGPCRGVVSDNISFFQRLLKCHMMADPCTNA